MSDTPRTDACLTDPLRFLALTLERELNHDKQLMDEIDKERQTLLQDKEKLERELNEAKRAHQLQRENYLALYDAVMGEGCIASEFHDVVAIAKKHREDCDRLQKELNAMKGEQEK